MAPLPAITACATCMNTKGQVFGTEQAILFRDALRLYTIAGAWLGFEEHIKGSLGTGKVADLVVLSDDPLRVPLERVPSLNVELVMVDGGLVCGFGWW